MLVHRRRLLLIVLIVAIPLALVGAGIWYISSGSLAQRLQDDYAERFPGSLEIGAIHLDGVDSGHLRELHISTENGAQVLHIERVDLAGAWWSGTLRELHVQGWRVTLDATTTPWFRQLIETIEALPTRETTPSALRLHLSDGHIELSEHLALREVDVDYQRSADGRHEVSLRARASDGSEWRIAAERAAGAEAWAITVEQAWLDLQALQRGLVAVGLTKPLPMRAWYFIPQSINLGGSKVQLAASHSQMHLNGHWPGGELLADATLPHGPGNYRLQVHTLSDLRWRDRFRAHIAEGRLIVDETPLAELHPLSGSPGNWETRVSAPADAAWESQLQLSRDDAEHWRLAHQGTMPLARVARSIVGYMDRRLPADVDSALPAVAQLSLSVQEQPDGIWAITGDLQSPVLSLETQAAYHDAQLDIASATVRSQAWGSAKLHGTLSDHQIAFAWEELRPAAALMARLETIPVTLPYAEMLERFPAGQWRLRQQRHHLTLSAPETVSTLHMQLFPRQREFTFTGSHLPVTWFTAVVPTLTFSSGSAAHASLTIDPTSLSLTAQLQQLRGDYDGFTFGAYSGDLHLHHDRPLDRFELRLHSAALRRLHFTGNANAGHLQLESDDLPASMALIDLPPTPIDAGTATAELRFERADDILRWHINSCRFAGLTLHGMLSESAGDLRGPLIWNIGAERWSIDSDLRGRLETGALALGDSHFAIAAWQPEMRLDTSLDAERIVLRRCQLWSAEDAPPGSEDLSASLRGELQFEPFGGQIDGVLDGADAAWLQTHFPPLELGDTTHITGELAAVFRVWLGPQGIERGEHTVLPLDMEIEALDGNLRIEGLRGVLSGSLTQPRTSESNTEDPDHANTDE